MSVFTLDQRYQIKHLTECPVDVQWHSDLDTHGSFCITVPLDQIIAIVTKLVACNRDWERRVKVDPEALRNLEVREAGGSLHSPTSYSS